MMVLISDGEETCGGDPAGMAKAALESGTSSYLPPIGFDLNQIRKSRCSISVRAVEVLILMLVMPYFVNRAGRCGRGHNA